MDEEGKFRPVFHDAVHDRITHWNTLTKNLPFCQTITSLKKKNPKNKFWFRLEQSQVLIRFLGWVPRHPVRAIL
jgi:hypothetical protein